MYLIYVFVLVIFFSNNLFQLIYFQTLNMTDIKRRKFSFHPPTWKGVGEEAARNPTHFSFFSSLSGAVFSVFFRYIYIFLSRQTKRHGSQSSHSCVSSAVSLCSNNRFCSTSFSHRGNLTLNVSLNNYLRNNFSLPVNYRWLTRVVGGQITKY